MEALFNVETSAHQDGAGICAPSSRSATSRSARLEFYARETLKHERDIAERVGGLLGEVRIIALAPTSGEVSVRREHPDIQHDEDEAKRDQG